MKKILLVFLFLFGINSLAFSEELTPYERITRSKILYTAGDNYLQKTFYSGGKVLRWNSALFPIKIYIKNSANAPSYYELAYKRAALEWQKASDGVLKFAFVDNEAQANIVFRTIKRPLGFSLAALNAETHTIAFTKYQIKNDKLEKAYINFYDKNIFGKYLQPYEVVNTAAHEMGHAIGICGHSNVENSLMYALYNPLKPKKSDFVLATDVNTVKLLYKTKPDITNGDSSLEKGTLRSEIIVGTKEERQDTELRNALKDAEIKPQEAQAKLNVAIIYFERDNYTEALNYAKQAEKCVKNNEEFFNVQVTYFYCYMGLKNKQEAKKCLDKALSVKDDPELRKFKKMF